MPQKLRKRLFRFLAVVLILGFVLSIGFLGIISPKTTEDVHRVKPTATDVTFIEPLEPRIEWQTAP